jgi:hypothetical protein
MPMAAASQPSPSAPDRHTIKVTELRTEIHEILENVHFRGWRYLVLRAGQPMIVILDHDEYERLFAPASSGEEEAADRAERLSSVIRFILGCVTELHHPAETFLLLLPAWSTNSQPYDCVDEDAECSSVHQQSDKYSDGFGFPEAWQHVLPHSHSRVSP